MSRPNNQFRSPAPAAPHTQTTSTDYHSQYTVDIPELQHDFGLRERLSQGACCAR